jgi:hypothetical protein
VDAERRMPIDYLALDAIAVATVTCAAHGWASPYRVTWHTTPSGDVTACHCRPANSSMVITCAGAQIPDASIAKTAVAGL